MMISSSLRALQKGKSHEGRGREEENAQHGRLGGGKRAAGGCVHATPA